MRIEDLIDTLFKDVVSPDANSPGEMVRSSLAGQMPGLLPRARAAAPMGAPVQPVARSPIPPVGAAPAPVQPQPAAQPQPAGASRVSLNPLGTMSRGYQSGGLFGAISNLFDEPQLLDRAAQEKARTEQQAAAQANQTVQALVKAGAPPEIAQASVGNPTLMKQAIETYLRPAADPLERQRKELEIRKLQKEIEGGGIESDKTPEGRAALARSLGLKEGSDAFNSYVMTSRLPREDQQRLTVTDKKAILEADEAVSATEGAIASLNRAMELSKTAYDGLLAGERGWLTSQFGSGTGNDTRELNQVVTEGALQQLKAIFGGMPTEGERKILLEIQGSAEMPQEVRDRIYQRAMALAQRRLKFNRDRAAELRAGTFYERDQPSAPMPDQPAEPSAAPPAVGTVQEGYRFKGGDPANEQNWEKVN